MPVNRAEFSVAVKSTFDGAGTEKAIGSHKELHETLRLAQEAAGAALGPFAELAHFLANPYLLAGEGAVLITKKFIDRLGELHDQQIKNLEASAEQAEQLRGAFRAAVEAAAAEVNSYENRLRAARAAVDLLAEGERNAIQLAQDHASALNTAADAQERLTVARIHDQEVMGHFTSAEVNFLTEQARRNQRTAHEHAADDEARSEITTREQEARGYSAEAAAAAGRLPGEREAAFSKDDQLRNAEKESRRRQTELDDAQKAEREAKATLYNPTAKQLAEGIGQFGDAHAFAEFNKKQLVAAEKRLRQAQEASDIEDDLIARYTREKETADKLVAADEALIIEKTKRAEQLRRDNEQAEVRFGETQRNRPLVDRADDETIRVNRHAALVERMNAGTATDADRAEYAGMTDVDRPGQYDPATGLPATAANDITSAAAKARQLTERLEHQRPQDRSNTDIAQLHYYLDFLMGAAENANAHTSALANHYNDLDRRMTDILAAQRNINSRLDQSDNTR